MSDARITVHGQDTHRNNGVDPSSSIFRQHISIITLSQVLSRLFPNETRLLLKAPKDCTYYYRKIFLLDMPSSGGFKFIIKFSRA